MQHRRKRIRHGLAALAGTTLALALGGALVFADGGSLNVEVPDRTGYAVDTTDDGAIVEYIGDLNETFGSSGSGVFDSFVRLQAEPQEAGFNTDAKPELDSKAGAFTHAILVSDIPVISVGGQPHWELFADINDSDSTKHISLNELEIFFTADNKLVGYPFTGTASKVYDFSGSIHINDVNQGSGRGDLRYNVPLTGINIPAECGYKNPACATYFVLYSQWGTEASGQMYASDGGFEEWKVKQYPYVVVTKTAATTLTRTFPWTIEKSVTPATWNLFTGETGTSQYTVTVDKGTGVDSNWAVSGSISINNPGGDSAVISSVDDVVSGAGAADVSCGVQFPYTLPKNQTLNCTYTKTLLDGATRTNTATVTLDYGGLFKGTAAVNFGSAVVTPVNDTIHVTDTLATLGATSADNTWTYTKDFTCDADEGTTNNTARITETGQNDSASVIVNCYEIGVTKDAATSLTRTYDWTIDKSVDPATWDLFTGESGTSEWTVSVDKTGHTDSAWAVSGAIHVNNPAPMPATINSVSDVISVGINASVDCGVSFPYSLIAGATLNCTYSATLPDATTRTNTATAVRQSHNYAFPFASSNAGTASVTGQASVSFASPTVTPVNATIDVTDTNGMSWDDVADDDSWTYDETFTCDADAGKHTNKATIAQTGQNDSADVTVSCYEISVTKDATETFTRTFHWTIDKSSNDPNGHALTLKPGEIYADYPYSITVGLANPAYTDSGWAVNGNIHVNNPNPIAATINDVSDMLATDGAATVECGVTFPYTLAAQGTLDCTYSKATSAATDQLNTATAVRQNHNYASDGTATAGTTVSKTGTANVDFTDPTTLVDESVTIVDDNATADTSDDRSFGPLSAADAPKTYTYKRTFGPYTTDACGEVVIKNTATFTTNDSGTTGSDDWTVTITIPCPTGCTLTQGYWKTHSEFGPAPTDEDWYNLGDVDGDGTPEGPNEAFYLSNMTWHQVFWTAPKGDAYYNLAHQYMAAKLNILSPADSPQAVDDAIAFAETFFATATPGTKLSKTDRAAVIAAAGTLGAYNEGITGPGHCSEDLAARSAS